MEKKHVGETEEKQTKCINDKVTLTKTTIKCHIKQLFFFFFVITIQHRENVDLTIQNASQCYQCFATKTACNHVKD